MSAYAIGAGGYTALIAHQEGWSDRLTFMQRDMDEIAAGKLPSRNSGRNATASDVEAYRARISTAAKAA